MSRAILPLIVFCLIPLTTDAGRLWKVDSGGSGDVLTIEAGIDSAAAADTVLVACGTYYERNIEMKSGIVLMSEEGVASCARIDAEHLHTVFWCVDCESATVIKGFTIANGTPYMGKPGCGGGMTVGRSPGIIIENCSFVGNTTHCSSGSSPVPYRGYGR